MTLIVENSFQQDSQSNDVGNSYNADVISTDNIHLIDTNPYDLKDGSVIQYGEPTQVGVIKWIGKLPYETEIFAGVEMVKLRNFITHFKINTLTIYICS